MEVGDLAVVLDARTKEFRAALSQAEKRISKFEKAAEKGTEQAGKGFDKLGGRLGGLKAAVTGLIAAFGAWKALQLGKEAVGLAASYESIQIRIGTLTGSVENAATVMTELNRLVLETPYSLEEIANAAASVAVTFKDNIDAVTEFTGYTADLAAAFGRPVELIGENLTRAFSAGLGAADAFREAGISNYILELSGKTKVADVTTQDLMDSIREMASEGGVAYQAAARRADSLEGVLSNTGIAADNLKRAFGEALSPAVVKAGKEVLQPFFERLKVLIEENEDAIQRFGDNLATVVDWMTHMVDVGPRGYAEMVDKAAELRQEIADLNDDLALHEKLTLGISWLQAEGGKQRLIQLETELMKTEALIRAEEERMAVEWKARGKTPPTRPAAAPPPAPSAAPGAPAAPTAPALPTPSWERPLEGGAVVFAEATSDGIEQGTEDAARPGGPLEGLGTAIGGDIREATKWGLIEGFQQGKVDAAGIAQEISDSMSSRFLDVGIEEMMGGLEDGFGDLFSTLGPKLGEALGMADMGPLSSSLQGTISTAIGVAFSLIAGSIGGTKARQTYAQIQGATIEDVREMRGISVGDVSVGIAEIGPRLEDAMAPLTGIAREHLGVTRAILAALRGGHSAVAGSSLDIEAGALLANSASLT